MMVDAAVIDRNNWLDAVTALDRHERASALPRAAACGERDAGVSTCSRDCACKVYISKELTVVEGMEKCGGVEKRSRQGKG